MPRPGRHNLSNIPQHVVQRGNNRQRCFFLEKDRHRYLRLLRKAAEQHGCVVHAYVLMTNHAHLLATPLESGAISRMMQALGTSYVRYVNDRYERTGTLWDGRFKACLVDDERYLLACYRYIELNPVRAGMVAEPGEYRWSSYPANAWGWPDPLVAGHPEYLRLGDCLETCRAAYRDLIAEPLEGGTLEIIRKGIRRQRPLQIV